jgi:hypothetical protein
VVLRALPEVEEVAHYGVILRVATRGGDAQALVRRALEGHGLTITAIQPARVTVEDAFVSMVREDERRSGGSEAA